MTTDISTPSQDYSEELLAQKSEKLLQNGSWIGIVVVLRLYKSLSTPEISKLLQIKKTTLFNYINQLEEEGFVQMDEEKSSKEFLDKGARARKYYQSTPLSEAVVRYHNQQTDDYTDILEEINKIEQLLDDPEKLMEQTIKKIRKLATGPMDVVNFSKIISQMNNTIMNIAYQEINNIIAKVNAGASDKELVEEFESSIFSPMTSLNINPFYIDLQTAQQSAEFMRTYWQFQKDIHEMKKRFEKENAENPSDKSETQYVFLFSSPVRNNRLTEEDE